MCKSHVLWFPGAEQKLEDWHNKSKVANLWASCFGLWLFVFWAEYRALVLGDQVAKYQKLSKQLSWGMGYLFLLLEEEGLTNMCCLSWLFKRAGFLSGNDYSLRQADFTGKPIPNLLNHFELAGKGLRNDSLKLKCSVRCLTPASCAVPRGWCKSGCPCCSQCMFPLPSVADENWNFFCLIILLGLKQKCNFSLPHDSLCTVWYVNQPSPWWHRGPNKKSFLDISPVYRRQVVKVIYGTKTSVLINRPVYLLASKKHCNCWFLEPLPCSVPDIAAFPAVILSFSWFNNAAFSFYLQLQAVVAGYFIWVSNVLQAMLAQDVNRVQMSVSSQTPAPLVALLLVLLQYIKAKQYWNIEYLGYC